MSSPDFDVVIAGTGMAGATLALALAQAGLKVAAVDAAPLDARLAPSFDGRASAIAWSNMNSWRALGVGEALTAEAQPIGSILVTDGRDPGAGARASTPGFLRFGAEERGDGDPGPLGWMVENRRVRAVLAQALIAAGVESFAPATVDGVAFGGREAVVRLADGRTLSTTLVAGADGRGSGVRRAAGIGVNGWDYPQAGVVATVSLDQPHEGIAHEIFLPGGPLAVLPLTAGPDGCDRASLVWTEKAARAGALADASIPAFEAHLTRRFGEALGSPRLIGPRFTYPLGLQIAETMVGPRLALVGDAAHAIHPIAGQGLNMGLKDAAALAEVVVDARRIGEDWGVMLTLDRYARWRRFDAAALALATDVFTRLFSNDDPLARLVRGAGLSVVGRLASAKRLFVREAGGALGELPRLMRGEAI